MKPRVALVACPDYEIGRVESALRKGLDLLGGIERFARHGETILLKPNLLAAAPPSKAVTTHPALFEAMCRILDNEGMRIRVGDSPGLGSCGATLRAVGFTPIAERFAAEIADFSTRLKVDFPNGMLLKQMILCPAVIDCDAMFSLSKLKTHGLTRLTGAVKNLFGCVPGILKGEYHVRMPDIRHFSQALLDICRRISPRLHVMDAIVAMSGNGPRSGDPFFIGALLLSDDPVALDRVACRLLHLPPEYIPTLLEASKSGLWPTMDSDEEIDLLGEPISSLSRPDFDIPRRPVDLLASKRSFPQFIKHFITPKPVIDGLRCTRCGVCVQVCPVKPKAMKVQRTDSPPAADMDICIRCYCCQELCPHGAIRLATPWLGRWLHRSRDAEIVTRNT